MTPRSIVGSGNHGHDTRHPDPRSRARTDAHAHARRHRRPRPGLSAVAVVLAVVALAGCGVREDESPRLLSADAIPAELSESAPASSIPSSGQSSQRIYVLETRSGTEEVLVPRDVFFSKPADASDFPRQVIEALVLLRPGENDTFTNAIPGTTSVLDVRMVDGGNGTNDVLEINLNSLEGVNNQRLKLAVAQMVFTATRISGVRGVRFLLNGVPVPVPLDSGESGVGAVVTPDDFPQTNPIRPITTTTPPTEPSDPQPTEPATDPAPDPTAGP